MSYADRDLLRSYFRKHRKDLRLAQPPKRLFAGVQSWAHGGEDDLDLGGVQWDLVDSCWLCLVRLWYKKFNNDCDVVAQHARCTDTIWYIYYPPRRCSILLEKLCDLRSFPASLSNASLEARWNRLPSKLSLPHSAPQLALLSRSIFGFAKPKVKKHKSHEVTVTGARCFFFHSVEVICCIYMIYIYIASTPFSCPGMTSLLVLSVSASRRFCAITSCHNCQNHARKLERAIT